MKKKAKCKTIIFCHFLKGNIVNFILCLVVGLTCCNRTENSKKTKENEAYNFEIINHIYPYIKTIKNGPQIDAEIKPGTPNQHGEYSFYFRLVVKMYETWDLVYLERIGVVDEEGIKRKLTDHIFIELKNVFPETSKGESRYINKIEWLDNYSANLFMNGKEYVLNVKDFL